MLEAAAVVEASASANAAVFSAADGRPTAWELVFSSAAAELLSCLICSPAAHTAIVEVLHWAGGPLQAEMARM